MFLFAQRLLLTYNKISIIGVMESKYRHRF
jgi:hypothetical protein